MKEIWPQDLFDIIRTLLQQPDLSALTNCLTQYVNQNALADRTNVLLYDPDRQRVNFSGKTLYDEDATLLANDPARRMISCPETLICNQDEFYSRWPQLSSSDFYASFGRYCLLPMAAGGEVFGGCEFIRDNDAGWNEKELHQLRTLAQVVALVAEQVQQHLNPHHHCQMLCRERDDYRILVQITNTVLSKLDLNELSHEVAREINTHFPIGSISIVLRSSSKARLTLYTTHFVDTASPIYERGDLDEAGTLAEQVIKSGEVLLHNLHPGKKLAPDDSKLLEIWGNQPQTLCLLPLKFGSKTLGVMKLAQCSEHAFSQTSLKLLHLIAARVAIAVDNAQIYQEIHQLKESKACKNRYLTENITHLASDSGEILGNSEAMLNVLRQVEIVASSNSTVLILGETGTGKELIAKAIHNLSERNNRRMVKINCAAIPAALLESELLGHERGAFTGASTQRIGHFELAHKSSLFLDEIGDMPLELQPKLLRVLQDREFERLGSNTIQKVDVRLIAATNRDLKKMMSDNEFRSDLFYRLNVFPITLPPLRERAEDIPLLVKAFTFKIARRLNRNINSIPVETLRVMSRMEWPGNIRELENVIERAVLLTRGNVLQLPLSEMEHSSPVARSPGHVVSAEIRDGEDESSRILRVLKETNGVVSGPRGAAHRLGLKRTTLLSRMKRLGIQ